MKRHKSNFLIVLSIVSLLLSSCGQRSEEILDKYESNYNSYDIPGLMSLLNSDAIIEITKSVNLTTAEEIKKYFEYDSVLSSSIKLSDYATSGDKALFVMSKTSDLLKTIGIDTARYSMSFLISGGKIKQISEKSTNETETKLNAFNKKFMFWALNERKDILKKIFPEGKLIYSKENAKVYLQMVIDWKRSLSTEFVKKK